MTVGDRGRAVVPRCPHGIVTGEFESTMPHRTAVLVLYVALCCAVGDAVGGRGSGGLGVDIAHVGLNTSAFQCMKDTAGLDWAVFRHKTRSQPHQYRIVTHRSTCTGPVLPMRLQE